MKMSFHRSLPFAALLALLSCLSFQASAQFTSLSAEAGYRYDYVMIDQKVTDYDIPNLGWDISSYGLLVSRTFKDRWEIETGLRFSEYSIKRGPGAISSKLDLTSALQLPLSLGYRAKFASLGRSNIYAIPSIGYSLNYQFYKNNYLICGCAACRGFEEPYVSAYSVDTRLFHLMQVGAKIEYDFPGNWATYIGLQQHFGFSEISTVYWQHNTDEMSGTDLGHTKGSFLNFSAGIKLNL